MRGCIAGWGVALPEQRLTNLDLEQRVDTTDAWIFERTGIRERRHRVRGRDDGEPRDRGRQGGHQARRAAPRRDRPADRRHRDTRAADPPHGRLRRRGARGPLRLLRPGRRLRGLRLRARDRIGHGHRRRPRPRAGHRRRDPVAGRRPARPRHVHPLRRRRRRGRPRAVARRRARPPRVRSRLRRLGRRPARHPRRRQRASPRRPTRSTRACSTSRCRARRCSAGRSARSSSPRASRSSAPASPPTTSTGSSPTRPTPASSKRPRTGSASQKARTVVNIDRYGNTSAASIPLALAEAADDGRLRDGDLVLMSGFGAGMTWGSAVLRWGRA